MIRSAFGYAGQKCSACSRVLVHARIADVFERRLCEAVASLKVGPADDPSISMGPVVDPEARARLLEVIAGSGARALYTAAAPGGPGWFVPPAIFRVDDASHPLMRRELFGPVLAVMRVDRFERALEIALESDYALTGAVYSRAPSHLTMARRRFRVGNLYLNRGSTGAVVARQPFGGFALSGTGTKAGGPGYLLQFADVRVVTENTMRRGFTPELG